MPPLAQPGVLRLAQRLRELREQTWPEAGLTQAALAAAFSCEGRLSSGTVSSWESLTQPKVPPRSRLTAYARFFATHRSIEGDSPRLISLDQLDDEERREYETLETGLLALRQVARRPSAKDEVAVTRSWHFDDPGPVTLVCSQLPTTEKGSLADPADPNYTELLSYADLDALVELHGHIRAENPSMDVFFKVSSAVVPDDLSSHVVLLGGIGWNDTTQRLSQMINLPIKQIEIPEIETGEIFELEHDGKKERFLPRRNGSNGPLLEDVGLIVRRPNPFNSSRSLTICNGIHSRGVLGAVRSLTDARLRDWNEKYIASNFPDQSNFAILMRVSIMSGKTMTPDFRNPDCVLYQWSGA
ncbi:MAG TPA: helix-turn-helix transcriptional regulator [Streptosporangiaceae bacterium]|nr:helix-turn-helix transcriptional regulator [Streptosporangiaceae bacterium]